jgi:16S rRNA (guanine527-N7)-methyltransferase
MNSLWQTLAQRCAKTLDPAQHEKLSRYLDLLLEANQKMNLTRIRDRADAETQHVGDALTLLPYLPDGKFSLADVGSGAGVPGIPLAIVCPEAKVVLIESTKKKAAFLRETAAQLELSNVQVLDSRAEEVAGTKHRQSFDIVTARAVGALNWLTEWCLPLVKVGGKVLAMKGQRIAEELPDALKPIRLLGGGEPIVHPVDLPGTEHHVIVEIKKITKTLDKYPRDPTTTHGKPLK